MRLGNLFLLATAFTSAIVTAAPTVAEHEVIQVEARDAPSFDFKLAARTMQELNDKAEQPGAFGKREDDMLVALLDQMQNANLLDLFVEHLSRSAKISEALSKEVTDAISNSRIQPETLFSALHSKFEKRDESEFDLDIEKRDLSNLIITIVDAIANSGLVSKVINYVLSNPNIIKAVESLVLNVLKNVNWSSIFNAILNSGIIQDIFKEILSIFTSKSTTKREDLENLIHKRGLSDLIVSLVNALVNSGIISKIINYIGSNPSIIRAAVNLVINTLKNLDWSSIFSAIKQSGIILSFFKDLF